MKFAGKASSEKLEDLRAYLDEHKSTVQATEGFRSHVTVSYLITSLSPIAWLLNSTDTFSLCLSIPVRSPELTPFWIVRGNDIQFNPMFYAYLLVDPDHFTLWIQPDAVNEEVRQAIESIGGRIRNYDRFLDDLSTFKGEVITDPKVNMAVVNTLGEDRITIVKSPVEEAQSRKNAIEREGFRNAYLRDGVAWARWAAWLEKNLKERTITEWQAAEKLTEFRSQNAYFAGVIP